MFALDTNLLVFPAPRRLLSGVAYATEHSIAVLPQVRRELIENERLAQAEVRRWANKMQAQYHVTIKETDRTYIQAVSSSIREWFEHDFFDHTPFVHVSFDQEAQGHIDAAPAQEQPKRRMDGI